MAASALTCASLINTDIKIYAGRLSHTDRLVFFGLQLLLFSFSLRTPHSLTLFFVFLCIAVPTIAPGNVQAESVNSTTIRFMWTAPNPQFINGINQGYKVSSSRIAISSSHHFHRVICQRRTCRIMYPV